MKCGNALIFMRGEAFDVIGAGDQSMCNAGCIRLKSEKGLQEVDG